MALRPFTGGWRGRVGVLAIGLLAALLSGPDGAQAQDRRDPVRETVDQVGGAIGNAFRSFGDDLGQIFRGQTRRTVDIDRKYQPGTIVVRTRERKLYYVTERGQALRYGVGVGREGFEWGGNARISRKAEWPDWRPPREMLERQPGLPTYMPGGPDNPLGARALYIGDTLYRIHGTREAHTIGGAVSSGCIRMLNNDVIDLYDRVKVGAQVYVYH
jgi:lipoprotein-anchoring transpeptidase ErfK/SrfK